MNQEGSQGVGKLSIELDEIKTDAAPKGAPGSPFSIQKILVPVDFSKCSLKALRYASAFAAQFGSSLTLIHVVQINYSGVEFGPIDFPRFEDELTRASYRELEKVAQEEVPEGVRVSMEIRTGRAVPEITRFAKESEIDLIILSTHGHTGLAHIFLGSTAENVLRYAPCPVLIVREHEHEFLKTPQE